jgi:hypothetical protein
MDGAAAAPADDLLDDFDDLLPPDFAAGLPAGFAAAAFFGLSSD